MALNAPKARKKNKKLIQHGDVRIDPYYWLNNREDPEVLAYLQAENNYYRETTAHTREFQEELFQEMKARIKEDDQSVPYRLNGYWYATRYETGKEYPIYTRRKKSLQADEEIIFNCNLLAENQEYFNLRGISISPNNTLAAFGVDTVSRRQYKIQIKNLQTGEVYPEIIENTTGSSVWAADNKTLFYVWKDPVTLRAEKVYKHVLGTPVEEDELVYHEKDETFNLYVYKTKSREYIVIGANSTLTSEYRLLKADEPQGEFRVFTPRERGLEYAIYHFEDHFYVMTNKDGATNFKLMKTPLEATEAKHWEEFVSHREEVLLEDVEIFREYYVLSERENGLTRLKITRWETGETYEIPFASETYIAYPYVNPEYDSHTFRYVYNSLTSPYQVVDFDMRKREKKVVKEQEVLGGKFDKKNYISERIWAEAGDGSKIPISLVYHRDTPLDGSSPLFQYGYGSYGSTSDPYFSSVRLSLLDRGFIYAIAHVRGGE